MNSQFKTFSRKKIFFVADRFMIFNGSPLTSTIYYGKKLHERGHGIS